MRTKIHVRVLDENNATQAAFNLVPTSQADLDCLVNNILNVAMLNSTTFQCEIATYPLSINGIKIQQTKKK